MPESNTEELLGKMDVLIGLTAMTAIEGKLQSEQIQLLSRAGLASSEIAKLVGTTANTVSVTLSKLKAKGKKPAVAKSKGA